MNKKASDYANEPGVREAYELTRDIRYVIDKAMRGNMDDAFYRRVRKLRRRVGRYQNNVYFRKAYKELGKLLKTNKR